MIADGRRPTALRHSSWARGRAAGGWTRLTPTSPKTRRKKDQELRDGRDHHEQVKALEADARPADLQARAGGIRARRGRTAVRRRRASSYLDFISGIGVVVLGHAHAGLADALGDTGGAR